MSITEFLLARIAEDEAWARLATEGRFSWASVDYNSLECEAHGQRWAPARVLAECAAKREIVQYVEAARADRYRSSEDDAQYRSAWWTATRLAAVYADHPDYQPEWAL